MYAKHRGSSVYHARISRQGKVNPDILVGVRGRYQRGLSGSEPDGVGGQVTVKVMF